MNSRSKFMLLIVPCVALALSFLVYQCGGLTPMTKLKISGSSSSSAPSSVELESVLLNLGDIELEMAEAVDDDQGKDDDVDERTFKGPFVVQLIEGAPDMGCPLSDVGSEPIEPGTYEEIEIEIEPAQEVPQECPLWGLSVYLTGTYEGTPLVYKDDLDIEFELENVLIDIDPATVDNLLILFDASTWFDGIDLSSAQVIEGVVLIDKDHNAYIRDQIEENIKGSADGMNVDDFYCDTTVEGGYYANVTVPSGAQCVLRETWVDGNVLVNESGSLETAGAQISGSIQAYGAKSVRIMDNTFVNGNVQIEKTSNETGEMSLICSSEIVGDGQLKENYVPLTVGCGESQGNYFGGNLQVEYNNVDFDTEYAVEIWFNQIGGDLQFFNNYSSYGNFEISENRIDGNLQCDDNHPSPTGSQNVVYGDAQGQCYSLAE